MVMKSYALIAGLLLRDEAPQLKAIRIWLIGSRFFCEASSDVWMPRPLGGALIETTRRNERGRQLSRPKLTIVRFAQYRSPLGRVPQFTWMLLFPQLMFEK